jgi:glycosyltransferase 2 family protein
VTEDNKKKKTMKLPIIISVTLSIVIIILILFFTVDAKTLGQLSRVKIKYEFFLIAIVLNILYWFLWGARMKIVANAIDKNVKISLWESTKIVIANLFLADITPSAAGGEPIRIYLLYKDGMTFGGATGAILGERFIDAIFMLIMVPIGIFIYKDIKDLGFISLGLTVGVVVFILLIILFIYIIIRPNSVKSFLFYLSKKLSRFSKSKDDGNKAINRINSFVDDFHSSMYSLSGSNKKSLFLASVLTVLFWSTGFLIPSFILLGLGLPPFFIESYAAQALLLIIIMLPLTPGSAGIAEVGIYGLYGVLIGTTSSSLIGVFVILYRFISFHMGLIAGAIFQYRIFKSVASFSLDTLKKEE